MWYDLPDGIQSLRRLVLIHKNQMQLNSLTLSDCGDRYPNGIYVSSLGCYYFVDYDGDLGYFIGLEDGSFEDETHYVDFDTMSDEDAANIRKIQEKIAANS